MTNTDNISDTLNRLNLVADPVNRGFMMTFKNRVTVSVRWGSFNFSDGKTTAECAAWNADTHEWVHVNDFDYGVDDVLPRLNTDQVAKFVYMASTI
jgi:hypothetical protein